MSSIWASGTLLQASLRWGMLLKLYAACGLAGAIAFVAGTTLQTALSRRWRARESAYFGADSHVFGMATRPSSHM
eukprot:m.702569 g.702569  ORF g.702569 m.702569 type:complete len:75 (+) comp22916_c1_seq3:239-463(+)